MVKKNYQLYKLSAKCDTKLEKKVRDACEKSKRTLSNFVRLACEEKADEINNGK